IAVVGDITNWVSYDEIDRQYQFFLRAINSTANSTAGYLMDDLKVVEGNAFEKTEVELPSANDIIYNAGVGTLPEDAPAEYDPSVDTELPTLAKDGYIFKGWYTTASFEDGTRVEKIAAGTKGAVQVYARWYRIVADEDYTNVTINAASGKVNGINYNNSKNMLYVATDAGENKYLTVNLNAAAGVSGEGSIAVKDNGYINKSGESVVSYEMSFMKIADLPLPTHIKLQLPLIDGGSMPTIFSSDDAGAFRLEGSDVVIGEIKEGEFITLRIAVDFETKTVTAYDENGDVIDSVVISGIASLNEINRQYHMFLHFRKNQNTHPDLAETGVIVDNIKVVEGLIF
ncbi:MAG: InlB B-repeat-containing protein, partial [Clostridia bacterium]|nr:InlB B-repeat-containing protein [Clostridia bacterium]